MEKKKKRMGGYKTKWTVFLLYPKYLTDDYGSDIYVAHTRHKDPAKAVVLAQRKMAQSIEKNCGGDIAVLDSLECIAVIRGHHVLELDATSFENPSP